MYFHDGTNVYLGSFKIQTKMFVSNQKKRNNSEGMGRGRGTLFVLLVCLLVFYFVCCFFVSFVCCCWFTRGWRGGGGGGRGQTLGRVCTQGNTNLHKI